MHLQSLADDLSKSLAEEIKKRRIDRGLSMNEVATRAGLAVSFIGYLEKGTRRPSVETLAKIGWVLGCPAADILAAVEPPHFQKFKSGNKTI